MTSDKIESIKIQEISFSNDMIHMNGTKKYIFIIKIITLILILFTFIAQKPAFCWLFNKSTDTELLAEALKSADYKKVDQCLDRQIELRNYIGVLQLKQHAIQMTQKERGRLTGIPGMTSMELAKQLKPWKNIIEKADVFTKKRKSDRQQTSQTFN